MHIISTPCVSNGIQCTLQYTLEYILGVDNGSHFLLGYPYGEKRVKEKIKKIRHMVLQQYFLLFPLYVRHTNEFHRRSIMVNGLKGIHIASGIPVEIPLSGKEMQLAMSKVDVNQCWDDMCSSVLSRGGEDIIGQIEIDFIVINGVDKVFH